MSKKAKRSGKASHGKKKKKSKLASSTTELKACGVLVFRGEVPGEFLLMEHADRLDIPKGHVDPGESEIECAYRELREETGIAAEDIELDPDFRFVLQYEVRNKRTGNIPAPKTLVVFLGRLVRPVGIQPTEHEGYQWREWSPPHAIQARTIDPLLAYAESYLARQEAETPAL